MMYLLPSFACLHVSIIKGISGEDRDADIEKHMWSWWYGEVGVG